jgi:hypothetical protein
VVKTAASGGTSAQNRTPGWPLGVVGGAVAAAGLTLPFLPEARVRRPAQPLTDAWERVPVEPRGATRLGISLRPRQAEALGLAVQPTLAALLAYPFDIIRLGTYWNRLEPAPGCFDPSELDWQLAAAEGAGKQVILTLGAVKTFGYPEFFVPAHHLPEPLPEGRRITPSAYPGLLAAATELLTRVVERYRDHPSIVAWAVEHESVDPLGMEHSWRLDAAFVAHEVQVVRQADPSRPVVMNGYLPMTLPVRLSQWWQTRDQGDSLAAAQRLADVVGMDVYPRHALLRLGPWTLYLDGSRSPWPRQPWRAVLARARASGRRVMVTEGQAEPWEAVTVPPNPRRRALYSCPPEQVIANYNLAMRWSRHGPPLDAYLFWGAEYWLLRQQAGDPTYLATFARILGQA